MIRRSGEGSQYTFIRFNETLTLKVFPPSICRVSDAFDKATGIFHVKWFHAERLHNHLRNIPPEEYRTDYFAKSGVPALDDDGNITADHSQHVSLFTICALRQSRLTAMEMQNCVEHGHLPNS
jgi:hypothetical protein